MTTGIRAFGSNSEPALLQSSQRSMAELIPAFDAFYAALTPEQQAQLNAFIAEHHGHRA